MSMGSREYTRTVNGQDLTITVDCSEYPRFLIEGAVDDDGNDVDLTDAEAFDLYVSLGPDIAGDMADAAHDSMSDR